MFNNRGYASEIIANRDVNTPISIYFPFGEEREKLKSYVFEQLHGDEAIKNANILNKFREEAAQRRHRHLHRLSYTEQTPQFPIKQSGKQQTLGSFPTLIRENFNNRFANYLPNQYRRYILAPTHKTPPPIYNFSSLDARDEIETKRTKGKLQLNPEISVNLYETVKNKRFAQNNRHNQQKKSQSIDINLSYRDKALSKIKQIAKKKKTNTNNQLQINSTDSSEILQQLEHKKQISKVECKHLEKQLKKFKRYRNYLKKAQKYHF